MTQTVEMTGYEVNKIEGTVTFEFEVYTHFKNYELEDCDLDKIEYYKTTFYLKESKKSKYARKYLDFLVKNHPATKQVAQNVAEGDVDKLLKTYGYTTAYNAMTGCFVEVEEKWLHRYFP